VVSRGYDLGLFGPESVTWRLHADPVLWLGGIRALYLQALHPEAMALLHEYSVFRDDPWGRLRRTADYVGVTTYGTHEEAARAGSRVRGVHRRLGLDAPHLLRWVHCCEVDSFLVAARRSGVRISPAEADQYVAEQLRVARLVGVPEDGTPRTVAGLAAYFEQLGPDLACVPEARAAARYILFPPMPWKAQLFTPARPAWTVLAGEAFALLPRWARRLYALPGLPTTDLTATALARSIRTAMRLLPARLREGPHYRDARARMAATPVRRLEALP
jgi:uncharacterized protein (DUF2236 family)